jgi:hypothetical protein
VKAEDITLSDMMCIAHDVSRFGLGLTSKHDNDNREIMVTARSAQCNNVNAVFVSERRCIHGAVWGCEASDALCVGIDVG